MIRPAREDEDSDIYWPAKRTSRPPGAAIFYPGQHPFYARVAIFRSDAI